MKPRLIFFGIFAALLTAIAVGIVVSYDVPASGINPENFGGTVEEQELGNPKMLWGETTNLITGETYVSGTFSNLPPRKSSFRSGINASNGVIVISLKNNGAVTPAYRAIENITTNLVDAYLPEFNERFVLTLTDTNGGSVRKTVKGLFIGQLPSLKQKTRPSHAKHNMPLWSQNVFMQELDPTKYFVLKSPGLYKLTLIQRIYVVDTNTFLRTVTLPPVMVDVYVQKG